MTRWWIPLLIACSSAAPPPVAKPAPLPPPPPPPVAEKPAHPYHDPDHKRGELPSAETRRTELAQLRQLLDAMYAHRLDKEKRYAIDEDALFAEAGDRVAAATTWGQYDAAIYGALAKFHDGHLSYHPPSTAAPSKGYGSFSLGLRTVLANDHVLIAAIEPGSDLAAAGVLPGDEVVAIDGVPIADVLAREVGRRAWSRPEAAKSDFVSTWNHVLVEKGTTSRKRSVTVQARAGRAPKLVDIAPQPATKRAERVEATIDRDIAIVTLRTMDPGKGRIEAIDKAFAAARASKGMVIDLRGVRGGVDTVGYRVPANIGEGTVDLGTFRVLVAPETIARRPRWKHLAGTGGADGFSPPQKITVDGQPVGQGFHGPIAVLIDASCASTCESVAAALHATLHATLVGETTAGSSGAPVEVKLPSSGGSVAIPTWEQTTPDGKQIESDGVAPDVLVVATPDALAAGDDPPLHAALDRVRALIP